MFAEGQVLDNTYRIERLIGEGGMGVVFEATHARLAGRYAIKVLLQKLSDNPEALERFDREARITSSLQHPNIVQVIDFNTHSDGTEYLVMEYLHGETLAERLARRGALPIELVVSVVEQVAAGLAAAHSHGVVHRDLKPDNVFLVPIEGRQTELAKVLDFGISKAKDLNHGLHGPQSALMGTPQYMSPEQCQGRSSAVDARTDQFSLAVITYEMLTGRPPFVGDSVGTVLSQVLYADPPAMNIDPDIEQVVRRGLAKEAKDRYASVTAFATALRVAVAACLAVRARTKTGGDDPLDNALELVAIASGDSELSQALAKTVRDKSAKARNRLPRGGWGAAAVAGAAVAVTLFFVVGAKSIERDRHLNGLPAPAVAPKQRIADFALEPPKLPALTAVTPSATLARGGGGTADVNGAPTEQPGASNAAKTQGADSSAPTAPTRPAASASGSSEGRQAAAAAKASIRPKQEGEKREADQRDRERERENENDRRQIQSAPFHLVERRTASPVPPTVPTSPPPLSRPAPGRSARSGSSLDDDAVLPLDESFGEVR